MSIFFLKKAHDKTQWLMDLVKQDPFLKDIAADLHAFGFEIHYPLFSHAGAYRPKAVRSVMPLGQAFFEAFSTQIQAGEFKAQFHLCSRFGQWAMAHNFVHELIHFYQDMHGLFLTPFEQGPIIQPDLRSHISLVLLCEAMAATEAIRASWRLRNCGAPQAWRGCFYSFDWHGLSKAYLKALRLGTPEEDAAQMCFALWYQSPVRRYYERRAFEGYQNHGGEYRQVCLVELVEALIPAKDLTYFSYLRTVAPDFTLEYKGVDNNLWQDITIGSPPYLWKTHKV